MIVRSIHLKHFRNHTDTAIDFSEDINLILGRNGAGKTNIIDAIHYLCMSRSFVSSSDHYVIEQGTSGFDISGHFEGNIRSSFSVTCRYSRGDGKRILVNESPLDRISDLIGMVPVVVLSPQDRKLTAEGPVERRSFIDSMISQQSAGYLRELIDYRKVLKQRNAVLSNYELSKSDKRYYLEPWNHQFARLAASIIKKRRDVLEEFSEYLANAYEPISQLKLKPHFIYNSIHLVNKTIDIEDVKLALEEWIEADFDKECERGYTGIGPHRDDILFYLDDMELRKFGSQGQHRLFALSLKMAELFYLSDTLDDRPVFLLDDVFGDLDPEKIGVLFSILKAHKGQIFITAANPDLFKDVLVDMKIFQVVDGQVAESECK